MGIGNRLYVREVPKPFRQVDTTGGCFRGLLQRVCELKDALRDDRLVVLDRRSAEGAIPRPALTSVFVQVAEGDQARCDVWVSAGVPYCYSCKKERDKLVSERELDDGGRCTNLGPSAYQLQPVRIYLASR